MGRRWQQQGRRFTDKLLGAFSSFPSSSHPPAPPDSGLVSSCARPIATRPANWLPNWLSLAHWRGRAGHSGGRQVVTQQNEWARRGCASPNVPNGFVVLVYLALARATLLAVAGCRPSDFVSFIFSEPTTITITASATVQWRAGGTSAQSKQWCAPSSRPGWPRPMVLVGRGSHAPDQTIGPAAQSPTPLGHARRRLAAMARARRPAGKLATTTTRPPGASGSPPAQPAPGCSLHARHQLFKWELTSAA